MIAFAALALAAISPVTAKDSDNIVVIGRRIAMVELSLGRDTAGRNSCALSRSSGDARIDAALCRRASKCLPRGEIVVARIDACIARQKAKLLADWRRGARA